MLAHWADDEVSWGEAPSPWSEDWELKRQDELYDLSLQVLERNKELEEELLFLQVEEEKDETKRIFLEVLSDEESELAKELR